MNISPRSEIVIQQLLAKQAVKSGKVAIGPLEDPAIALLKVFVNHFDELSRIKGEERARKLRERYISHTATPAAKPLRPAGVPASPPITAVAFPKWRLVTLRCCSIRGIAPPGEPFEFPFESQSCLLYGPNGSGKSSLISAVIWVLTGTVIVDTTGTADQSPLYAVGRGKSTGAKVRDWPVMATLPPGSDLAKASADCRAELLLERPGDHARLWLGRSHGAPLQVSTDAKTWTPLGDISSIGIAPLDIQLSLIAPTMFGRRSIEEADNTRSILSLMLGFDDLERLGELASSLSMNRTKLEKQIEEKVKVLHETLRLLPARLPEASESAKAIQDLAAAQTLTVARFDTAIQQLEDAANAAESYLAQTLGLAPGDGAKSALPIDNNETEQLMKQVALGRKNWLFAGSVAGGERNAGFLTLASSALRNDLDVWLYVKDVLDQLLAGRTDYDQFLPWTWAASHPEAIRTYRAQERRDRSARQSARRASRRGTSRSV